MSSLLLLIAMFLTIRRRGLRTRVSASLLVLMAAEWLDYEARATALSVEQASEGGQWRRTWE